jgi:hypothetical protein
VYEEADLIASIINDGVDYFEELEWTFPPIGKCLVKFCKTSLLAHFCFAVICVEEHRKYRKSADMMDAESVAKTEEALTRYRIPYKPFESVICSRFPGRDLQNIFDDDAVDDAIYSWVLEQEEHTFLPLWEKMADEVFHLLFGNRDFLLTFNVNLAEFRRERGDRPSPRCRIPQWVKRAVYFRENGKCALCKRDLSGLIAIDQKQHYDHIVSLKALGINDPCNIQLLCAKCNLTKAASPARTSSLYDPWWE